MPLEDAIQPLCAPWPVEVDTIRGCILRQGIFHHSRYIKHSHGQHTSLLDLSDYLVDVSHPLVHLPRLLVCPHVIGNGGDGEDCWLRISAPPFHQSQDYASTPVPSDLYFSFFLSHSVPDLILVPVRISLLARSARCR